MIFLLIATVLFSFSYSQNTKGIVGYELTPTITSIRGNTVIYNFNSRLSFSTGLTFEYFIDQQFSLKSGLLFERKGSKIKMDEVDQNGAPLGAQETKINFDYSILPVLCSYSTKGKTKLYINAGPYVGFLLSQKNNFSSVGTIPEHTEDNSENTKHLDLGLSLGLGLNFKLNEKLLLDLGLRENRGLINVNKLHVTNGGSITTNSFGLQLGLKYIL